MGCSLQLGIVFWQMQRSTAGVAAVCRGGRIMPAAQDLLHRNCSVRCTLCEILEALRRCALMFCVCHIHIKALIWHIYIWLFKYKCNLRTIEQIITVQWVFSHMNGQCYSLVIHAIDQCYYWSLMFMRHWSPSVNHWSLTWMTSVIHWSFMRSTSVNHWSLMWMTSVIQYSLVIHVNAQCYSLVIHVLVIHMNDQYVNDRWITPVIHMNDRWMWMRWPCYSLVLHVNDSFVCWSFIHCLSD